MDDTMENGRGFWSRGRIAAIAGAALVLAAGGWWMSRGSDANAAQAAGGGPGGPGAGQMPPMPVDADSARRQAVTDAVRATGRIEAVSAIELRPDEQGRVTELLFQEGQYVAKGAPLVRIDDAMPRAQANKARAERDLARQQLARVQRLREQNAAPAADVEKAEAAARAAEAALAVLELQISRSIVRAPFAGVVGQRFVSVGDYVTSQSKLLTLTTVDPQRAVIEVPERHAVRLRRGQTIDFAVAAEPGRLFRAEVDFIDPVVQDANRTILVKGRTPNPDRVLRPGMFIEARLATAVRDKAVVVPEDAVQPLRTANVVWAIKDGKASRREVRLGSRSSGVVEVLSGVEAGELVVVGGLERMFEGAPLAPNVRTQPNVAATEAKGRTP